VDGGSGESHDRRIVDRQRRMSTEKSGPSPKKRASSIFVGALLGLYYGVFYQPSDYADVGIAIRLAILAAVATVTIRTWKKKVPFKGMVKEFFMTLVPYLIFMLSLALRKYAFDLGGKTLVILESTTGGAMLGLLFSRKALMTGETDT